MPDQPTYRVEMTLDLGEEMFVKREIKLPFAPTVGMQIELTDNDQPTIFDRVKVAAFTWIHEWQVFNCNVDFILSEPNCSPEVRFEEMKRRGWKPVRDFHQARCQ